MLKKKINEGHQQRAMNKNKTKLLHAIIFFENFTITYEQARYTACPLNNPRTLTFQKE